MYRSESIVNNLLIEVDVLNNRINNIKNAYFNTDHDGLRERLFHENKNIFRRLNEIYNIAKSLKNITIEKISFSGLLLEKCERTIYKTRTEKYLFFI